MTISTSENKLAVDREKTNLLGLSPEKLEQFFKDIGEKPFRATQVLKWIHQIGIDDFDQMTNLAKDLREKMKSIAEIKAPEVVSYLESKDGTCKWIIRVRGGDCVEAVFIPEKDRGTLCISSQVGCALDCSFCATGKQGFSRDLDAFEIIGQLWIAVKAFNSFGEKANRVVSNVVMMGMGEPLLNFDNVVDSMGLMLNDNAYGLSKRRVTLSTSGVVPMIDKLAEVSDVSLAISLHAPNDELRDQLVPINKKYPISSLLASAQRYLDKMPDVRRKITIEYTLMDHINDRDEHARELATLLSNLPCKINLIPFNPFDQSDYRRVTKTSLYRFRDILKNAGHTVTVRTTRGDDISAACGQLAGTVSDKTRRSERHANKHQLQPIKFVMS